MKNLFTIFLCLTFATSVFSQDEKDHKYIFSGNADNPVNVSGFASVFTQFSSVNKNFAVSNGGGAAILFNQRFFLGGYGQGVSTRHDYKTIEVYNSEGTNTEYDNLKITMGHGGFWLGYITAPHKAVHITGSTKIGFGAINLTNEDYPRSHDDEFMNDHIFVLIPEIGMDLNLLKWFKINVTIGYRYISGISKEYKYDEDISPTTDRLIEKKYFDKNDFNSITGSVNLVFGWFHQ